jgi:hypothetical protein
MERGSVNVLHPRTELNIVADMIANGTALGAFRASSLICTLVSKPAVGSSVRNFSADSPLELIAHRLSKREPRSLI